MFRNSGSVPAFTADGSLHDMNSYLGRLAFFFDVVSPLKLLTTDAELARAQELLRDFDDGKRDSSVTDRDLWEAKSLVGAIIHPQTKEKIPWFARMSAFVPTNVPIACGMLMSPPTLVPTLFWQWVNQSYNVAVNYANRNASNSMSDEQIMKAYLSATVVSCSLAVGLGALVKRANFANPVLRGLAQKLVPFTASSCAGASNVMLMRWNETVDGINVYDSDGNDLGKSVIAGQAAVTQVATTRFVLPAPVLMAPPLAMAALRTFNLLPKGSKGLFAVEVGLIGLGLSLGLPIALALFPQTIEVETSRLEEKFQNLVDSNGNHIKTVTYNKGL